MLWTSWTAGARADRERFDEEETNLAMLGQLLGHYLIVEKIGEGGMGEVYRATDQLLRRDVALKILPHAFASDAQHMARFEREARVLASLSHPNIASIYDLLEADGGHALVMELIDGPTVADRLREGPFELPEFVSLALQITKALAAAHAQGIVHRDLKPANVKVTPDGRVKILDFGLAQAIRPRELPSPNARTSTGIVEMPAVAGTLPYMAPEQLRGEPVDARTDIYATGVLLHEMATGYHPFRDSSGAQLIGDIQHTPPPPLRASRPNIPDRLDEIVQRCQQKQRGLRYDSMNEVVDALRGVSLGDAQRSLAVLYFENPSHSEEDEYFRDGMTEDIIIELSKLKGLSVLSRSSVLAFRDRNAVAAQVGRKLDVSYVLDGSVRRQGERLRVTTQLMETSTSRSIWAERFDREMEDVFAIQSEIAESIARALRVVLTDAEKRAIAKAPTTDVGAYEHYLRGRQHFQLFRRKSIEFAAHMFRQAIDIDPQYARAFAGLADCHSYLYMFWAATEENLAQADIASRRAVELDPELAEAHVARGVAASIGKRHEDARNEFETAVALDPRLFEAYYFCARGYYAWGKPEQAVVWFERAMEVRPEDYQSPCLLGSMLAGLGRKEEADAAYRKTLELAEKHLELYPGDTRALYFSAISLCQLGEQRERSLELAERALAMDPDEPQVLYNVACAYTLLGRTDAALDCLAQVITHGDWWKTWMKNDPDLERLHQQPRFQELLDR